MQFLIRGNRKYSECCLVHLHLQDQIKYWFGWIWWRSFSVFIYSQHSFGLTKNAGQPIVQCVPELSSLNDSVLPGHIHTQIVTLAVTNSVDTWWWSFSKILRKTEDWNQLMVSTCLSKLEKLVFYIEVSVISAESLILILERVCFFLLGFHAEKLLQRLLIPL